MPEQIFFLKLKCKAHFIGLFLVIYEVCLSMLCLCYVNPYSAERLKPEHHVSDDEDDHLSQSLKLLMAAHEHLGRFVVRLQACRIQ